MPTLTRVWRSGAAFPTRPMSRLWRPERTRTPAPRDCCTTCWSSWPSRCRGHPSGVSRLGSITARGCGDFSTASAGPPTSSSWDCGTASKAYCRSDIHTVTSLTRWGRLTCAIHALYEVDASGRALVRPSRHAREEKRVDQPSRLLTWLAGRDCHGEESGRPGDL